MKKHTEKTSLVTSAIRYEKVTVEYAASKAIGFRTHQEDYFDVREGEEIKKQKFSFFAIFDGHSGGQAAKYCSQMLYHYVYLEEYNRKSKVIFDELYEDNEDNAIKRAFRKLDNHLKRGFDRQKIYDHNYYQKNKVKMYPGTTCTMILVVPRGNGVEIICANAGDSRAIAFSRKDDCESEDIIQLSLDHTLSNKNEVKRLDKLIKQTGVETRTVYSVQRKKMVAKVREDYYKPTLQPTRGFGDFEVGHNKIFMTPEPEIKRTYFSYGNGGKRSVVVIGSDGLFGGINNTTTASFVDCRLLEQLEGNYDRKRKRRLVRYYKRGKVPPLIKKGSRLKFNLLEICNELIDHCVAQIPIYFEGFDSVKPIKTLDNISVILIAFHSPNQQETIDARNRGYEDFDFHLISDSESDSDEEGDSDDEKEGKYKKVSTLIGADPGKRGILRVGGVCWVIALLQALIHIDKGRFVNLLSAPKGPWSTVVTKIKDLSEKMWKEETTAVDVLRDKETLRLCQDVKAVVKHDIMTDYGNSVKFLKQLFDHSEEGEKGLDFTNTVETVIYNTAFYFEPKENKFIPSRLSGQIGENIIPFSPVIYLRSGGKNITFQEYFSFREMFTENPSMTDYSRSIFLKFPQYLFVKAGTELSGPRSFNSFIKDITEEVKIRTHFFDERGISLELKAVVVKLPGHFYAYAKVGKEWYTFDDDRVNVTTFDNIKYSKKRFSVLVFKNNSFNPNSEPINVKTLRKELVANNKKFLDIIRMKFEAIKTKHDDFYYYPSFKDIELSTEKGLRSFSPLVLGFGIWVVLIIKSPIDLIAYPFDKIVKNITDHKGFPRVGLDLANIPNIGVECRLFYPRQSREDVIKHSLLKNYFSNVIEHKTLLANKDYSYTICDFNMSNIINRRQMPILPIITKKRVSLSDVEEYLKKNNFYHTDLNKALLLKSDGYTDIFERLLKRYYKDLRTLLYNLAKNEVTTKKISVDYAIQYLLDKKKETLSAKDFITFVNNKGKEFEKKSEEKFEYDMKNYKQSDASHLNGKKVQYSDVLYKQLYLVNNNNYIKTIEIIKQNNKKYLKAFKNLFSVFKNFGVDRDTAANRCATEIMNTKGNVKKSIENMKNHILKILSNNGYSEHVQLYEKLAYHYHGNYIRIFKYLRAERGEERFDELLDYIEKNEIEKTVDELAKMVVLDKKRRGDGYKNVMDNLKYLVSEREPHLVTKIFIGKEDFQIFTDNPYDIIDIQYAKFDIYYQKNFESEIKTIKTIVAEIATTKYESLERKLSKDPPYPTQVKEEFFPFIIKINTTNIVYPKSDDPKRENAREFYRRRIKELTEEIEKLKIPKPTKHEDVYSSFFETQKTKQINEKEKELQTLTLSLMKTPDYGDFYVMFSILPVFDSYPPTGGLKFNMYLNEFYFKDKNPKIRSIKGIEENKTKYLKLIAIRSITHVLGTRFVQFDKLIIVPKENEVLQEAQRKKYTNPTHERLLRAEDYKKIESEFNQAKSRHTIEEMLKKEKVKLSDEELAKALSLSKEDEITTKEENLTEVLQDETFLDEILKTMDEEHQKGKKRQEEKRKEKERREFSEKFDKEFDESIKKYEEERAKDLEKQPLGYFGTVKNWITEDFGFYSGLNVPDKIRKKAESVTSPSDKVFAYMRFKRSVKGVEREFDDGLMLYHVIKTDEIRNVGVEIIKKLKEELTQNNGDYEKARILYKNLTNK
jgi:serine/threonine protein phosphatase PrpC